MKGWVVTREVRNGTKRYDAYWRVGAKVKCKTFSKRKTADRYLTDTVKRVHDGTWVEVQPTLLGAVFDRWLTHSVEVRLKEGTLKPSTASAYRSVLDEHLRPAFGAYRSDRLTLGAVEEWRRSLAERIAAGTLAPKTTVNLRNLLHTILAWARHPERRYLAHDPMAGLERLRLPRAKKRPHFEPQQVAELLRLAARTPPDDTIIRVALYSGVRRGELFGLRWSDIDAGNGRDGGRLHVRRSLSLGALTTPKTEGSNRAVDVPQRLLDDLAIYRLQYPEIGEGFVFRQTSGRPMDPDAWHRERLVPALTEAGLRLPGTGLHSLRHTYVSLLIAQGEDPRYVADQVGHATTRLTTDIYQHVFSAVRGDAMRRLGDAIPSSRNLAEPAATEGTGGNSGE